MAPDRRKGLCTLKCAFSDIFCTACCCANQDQTLHMNEPEEGNDGAILLVNLHRHCKCMQPHMPPIPPATATNHGFAIDLSSACDYVLKGKIAFNSSGSVNSMLAVHAKVGVRPSVLQ